jgi:hypothetical protein
LLLRRHPCRGQQQAKRRHREEQLQVSGFHSLLIPSAQFATGRLDTQKNPRRRNRQRNLP